MAGRSLHSALPVMALLAVFTTHGGGWAVITVEDLPDQVVVGRPVTLTFAVRQHGRTLLGGLAATVEARAGRQEVSAAATPASETGRYSATLTLPQAGEWTFTIHSGFGKGKLTLLPLVALQSGRTAPALAEVDRGQRLFVAKGCVTCHVHPQVERSGTVEVGPDLTGRRYPPDYLKRFLTDPVSIVRPARSGPFQMPNLNLKPTEVAALATFINGDGQALRSGE
ncbi:MAG: c-type cytochrome [Gemmatimonadales bacterium]